MMSAVRTPFGERSTAAEVAAGVDLSERRAIVTGASSGIGVETARVLADHGAEVTLAVRDIAAGESVAASIRTSTGNGAVDVRRLELADPASVAAFVDGWDGPLDILINNAGVMAIPELTLTPRGDELHFATNHLGHFQLATGLARCPSCVRQRARGVAVVQRTSVLPGAVRRPGVRIRPLHPVRGLRPVKDGQRPVRGAKPTSRWERDGITVNAVMPGGIATAAPAPHRSRGARAGATRGGCERRAQDRRAGRCHVDPRGGLAAARRRRRPLPRGLQRGRDRQLTGRLGRPPRRRPVRA